MPKNNAGMTMGEPKKKARKSVDKGYATYIHKVLKQVHPQGITISASAMEVVNALVEELENRVTNKAFDMAKFQKKSTLSAKHMQTATKVIFPREMGGLAISEGTKATSKFFA